MLSIIIDSHTEAMAQATEPSLYPETMSIAGKEVLIYWLEWARTKGFREMRIYAAHTGISDERANELFDLYGVKITYRTPLNIENTQHLYCGVGIFMDDDSYRTFESFDEFLELEQELIHQPLDYSAPIGYGKNDQIRIGKNVFIHSSVKLSGYVVIGDNCTIGKNVTIENSVINSNVQIQEGSVIKNAYISGNVRLLTELYLEEKALFATRIYDKESHQSLDHDGICMAS